jgi:hypothetical protein
MRKEKTETIRLPQSVKKQLDKFRIYDRETYSDILLRLMEQAKLSPEIHNTEGDEDGNTDT